jgi:hypothetical protein
MSVCPTQSQALSDSNGSYKIVGIGSASCAEWTSERKKGETWAAAAQLSWVLGYATAVNRFGPWSSNVVTDAQSVLTWLDTYCAQHPRNNIATATGALAFELGQRVSGGVRGKSDNP